MAGAIPDMLINVRLETAQLKADMANLEAKFKGLGSTVAAQQNPIRNFGKSLLLAAGVGLSVAGLTSFTRSVITAGEESQRSDARLLQISKSMGIFGSQAGAVTNRLKDYADAQARVTGVDDDVIKQSQAKLLTFSQLAATAGVMGGAFDRATKATVDMAAAGFGDATNNAVQLGKALQDPIKGITALSRSGISFTEQEKSKIKTLVESNHMLDAQSFVLKAIEKQVGGTAAASATATDKMKVAFGQVEEAIGIALLPVVEKFSKWVQETGPKVEKFFKDLSDPTTEVGRKWKEFTDGLVGTFKWVLKNAEAIKVWAISIGSAVAAWKLYKTAVDIARSAQILFDIALAASPMGAFMILVGGLVGLYLALAPAADKARVAQEKLAAGLNVGTSNGRDSAGNMIGGRASQFGVSEADVKKTIAANEKRTQAALGDRYTAQAQAYAASQGLKGSSGLGVFDPGSVVGGGGSGAAKETAAQKNRRIALSYLDTVNTKVAAANKKYNDATATAYAEYATKTADLYKKHADDMAALEKDHGDKVADIQRGYADKFKDIIQKSMDELRTAFAQATATDVGAMFKDLSTNGAASADQLIAALKTKFDSIKKLAEDAATLSGLGFSQTFIEQVVAQGPQVGDQMAQALIAATPESQKELQDLFTKSETLSNRGMDSLSKAMYEKSGLATDALKTLYSETQADLTRALADEQKAYTDRVADINRTLTDGLADANTALNDALTKAATALNDTLDALDAAMTKKLASLKGKLGGVQQQIADARNGLNSSYVDTTPPVYNAQGFTTSGNVSAPGSFMNTVGYNASQGPAVVVNNYNQTDASPALIADTTVAAIKFGTTIGI